LIIAARCAPHRTPHTPLPPPVRYAPLGTSAWTMNPDFFVLYLLYC
jgi:hypothetical protein